MWLSLSDLPSACRLDAANTCCVQSGAEPLALGEGAGAGLVAVVELLLGYLTA